MSSQNEKKGSVQFKIVISRALLRLHVSQSDGQLLKWMCTLWERACGVLLSKIATANNLARDQVCYHAGAVTWWCPSLCNNFEFLRHTLVTKVASLNPGTGVTLFVI